jgi:hypothetical protein
MFPFWLFSDVWYNPIENTRHSKHGERLKSRIIHLYGVETARYIRLLENLRIKKAKLLTSLSYKLLRTLYF